MVTEPTDLFSEDEWEYISEAMAFSCRQRQIALCLLRGMSDKQIAGDLGIRLPTVRTHMGRLFTKMDVQDRCELILEIFRCYKTSRGVNSGLPVELRQCPQQ